jgi:hypothetical protein
MEGPSRAATRTEGLLLGVHTARAQQLHHVLLLQAVQQPLVLHKRHATRSESSVQRCTANAWTLHCCANTPFAEAQHTPCPAQSAKCESLVIVH